jgi:hypothetical protein
MLPMQNPFLLYCTTVGSGLLVVVFLESFFEVECFFLGILVVFVPLALEVGVAVFAVLWVSLEIVPLVAVELEEILRVVILTHDLQVFGTI